MFRKVVGLSVAALSLALLVSSARAEDKKGTKDIVDTAVAAGQFKTLAKALAAADLIETLKGPGPFTVFAPTDAAFAKIPAADLDALLQNKEKLRKVLTYHVLSGMVPAREAMKMDGKNVKTVAGDDIMIAVANGAVMINKSNVTKADIKASNGVIHVIDAVLMPSQQ